VRRPHPSLRGWRTLVRLKTSLVALAFQLTMLTGLASAVVAVCVLAGEQWVRGELAVCVLVGEQWARGELAVPERLELVVAFLAFGALPIVLGAWLTAGLGHVRHSGAWLAFAILALGLISLDCVGEPLARRLIEACGFSLARTDFRWDRFAARLAALTAIITIATAGIPLGMLARLGYQRWRRNRWRARRRRLRARRTSR
ncbi:MAG: hypothetical protein ACYSWT_18515, partial [Planctomycetota bacterium]